MQIDSYPLWHQLRPVLGVCTFILLETLIYLMHMGILFYKCQNSKRFLSYLMTCEMCFSTEINKIADSYVVISQWFNVDRKVTSINYFYQCLILSITTLCVNSFILPSSGQYRQCKHIYFLFGLQIHRVFLDVKYNTIFWQPT